MCYWVEGGEVPAEATLLTLLQPPPSAPGMSLRIEAEQARTTKRAPVEAHLWAKERSSAREKQVATGARQRIQQESPMSSFRSEDLEREHHTLLHRKPV
jgi:hypothetical protein